jgi:hypothetical protein
MKAKNYFQSLGKKSFRGVSLVLLALFLGISLALLALLSFHSPAFAQEQDPDFEYGPYCVQNYLPGAVCTANDVRIKALVPVPGTLVDTCDGTPGDTFTAEFIALVSAEGSPNRYDIGKFIDLSGSPEGALSGENCFHGFARPPITTTPTYGDANGDMVPDIWGGPWWNGEPADPADFCGDIETNTQIFSSVTVLTLPCVDNSDDGRVDVHVCTSWDNNVNSTCADVTGAIPGTNSKCGCATIEMDFTPTMITLMGLEASSVDQHSDFAPMIAVLTATVLFIAVGLIIAYRHSHKKI